MIFSKSISRSGDARIPTPITMQSKVTPSPCLFDKHIRHFPDTKRPNPTFSSAATQTPDSKLITLLCGWYRPLCHCHRDRPTGSSRDQTNGLEQLHLPTIPLPLESPYTIPD